eukprot:scaffold117072_cov17-Tisochrysis_lutea.AAC.1
MQAAVHVPIALPFPLAREHARVLIASPHNGQAGNSQHDGQAPGPSTVNSPQHESNHRDPQATLPHEGAFCHTPPCPA